MTVPSTIDVLQQSSNKDLQPLVEYILKASTTERLSKSGTYKDNSPNHTRYTREIFEEIKSFGGNTYVNIFRGGGPEYSELVCDVARKFKIKDPDDDSMVALEKAIIVKILKEAFEHSQGKEREEIEAALKDAGLKKKDLSVLFSGGSLATVLGARMAGFAFYRISIIVANAVAKQVLGHGLRLGANAALAKGLAVFAGPIGLVITGLWTAIDIAGPAYRVTVPCIIHIAMLRQRMICEAENSGRDPFDAE